jgi:hypothetical protein
MLFPQFITFVFQKNFIYKLLCMKNALRLLTILFLFPATISFAQGKDSVMVAAIIKEANENSQLKNNAHELLDEIGPRLVGTPKMQQAHDWAVAKYTSWGIGARNEKWGEWRGWERGCLPY